jgi:hypothetical protein
VLAILFKTKRQRLNALISATLVCIFFAAALIYNNATKTPCDDNRTYTSECETYLRENPEAKAMPSHHHEDSTAFAFSETSS